MSLTFQKSCSNLGNERAKDSIFSIPRKTNETLTYSKTITATEAKNSCLKSMDPNNAPSSETERNTVFGQTTSSKINMSDDNGFSKQRLSEKGLPSFASRTHNNLDRINQRIDEVEESTVLRLHFNTPVFEELENARGLIHHSNSSSDADPLEFDSQEEKDSPLKFYENFNSFGRVETKGDNPINEIETEEDDSKTLTDPCLLQRQSDTSQQTHQNLDSQLIEDGSSFVKISSVKVENNSGVRESLEI